ncbi:PREDICTED: neurabin-1 isoform X1 [Thamnophis sirtalis]|uniref:Neurabin-1 n=1 Tax=Thamnophis sirtalis TaxID=35019 RepID=A0A6I9XIJ9_9SAUR|nr:PREDICTED: neurabin-1 isoform X1 [Thamnophis sirtalis]
MKSECSGEKPTIRSASPHRNSYRAQFQALRKNFDEEQETVEAASQQTRGRNYGSNVSRIKKIFMQMGAEPSENAEERAKVRRSLVLSEGRNKPIEFVEKADGTVIQLEASISERISIFDTLYDESSKFTETRKGIKRNKTQPSKHCSPKKEKTASADEDDLYSFKSSKGSSLEDSMDSSSSKAEIVPPTVSQLAVLEKNDSQKDVVVSEKESSEEFTVTGHYPLNLSAVNNDLSPTVGNLDSFSPLKDTSAWPLSKQNTCSVSLENSPHTLILVNEKSKSTFPDLKTSETQIKSACFSTSGPSESLKQEMVVDRCDKQDLGETKNEAETDSKASSLQKEIVDGAEKIEMPVSPVIIDDSTFHVASFSVEDRSEREVQKEQADFQSSQGNYKVHKIESIYSFDWGKDETEEDDQEDSDDNSGSDHDKSFEVRGLSEEEEIPPARKIMFSTAPIKVFKTYSDEEYDRKNETVDPILSSAEYELEKRVEKLDVFPVDIEKDEQGFGISIIGMGIGMDTGYEKLGIFIKTITADGPAEKDGRIRLNDQIIEVGGVNMVGVSQDFASAVLRCAKGRVRFIIGREKAGQVSEVGKLIKQTIEYDQRQRAHHYAHFEAEEEFDEETEEYATDEDEDEDDFEANYPKDQENIHFFESPENDDTLSPEELTTMTEKFKELQVQYTVKGSEVKQLKRKLQIAENEKIRWQVEKNILQQNIKESNENMVKIEAYWTEAQTLCQSVNGHLKESQEQYKALEKKYNKAKKLIKEFQQKELEYMQYHDDDKKKIEDLEKAHFLEVQNLKAQIRELEAEVLRLLRQNESQLNNNNNAFEQQTSVGESSEGNETENLDGTKISGLDTLVQDFNEAVPETERLDSKALKTRLQLSVKNKRSLPTRTRLCDSISSTDGEDSLERKNINLNDDFSPSSTSSADLSGLGTGQKTPGFSHSTIVSSNESLDMIDDEILDDGQSPKHSHFPTCAVSEWSVQQVSNWLKSLNLEHYISEFTAHNINGECLLQLDGSKLKFLGMTSSQERAVIKKKIKEMKANLEKARKAQEKMEKQREKLRKKENDQFQRKCRKLEKQSSEPIQGANEQ